MQNLNKKIDRMASASRRKNPKSKGWLKILFILIVLAVAIILPLRGVYAGAKKAQVTSKALAEAYKNQNLDQMITQTKVTQDAVTEIDRSLWFLVWMRLIPIVGGYYQDAKGFSEAGVEELKAASVILESLSPHKAELGFNGQPGAGTDRVQQGLKILEKSLPHLDKIEPNLKKAREAVKDIDTNKYPENVRGRKFRDSLTAAKNFIIGSHIAVTDGRAALEVAPEALGQPTAKNYFMLFQNDKEIRATGGFLTAFATMKVDEGELSPTNSDDIYRLDERLLQVCQNRVCPLTPPAPIAKYLPEVDGDPRETWSMRDSNISPDVPTAAGEFERMFKLLGQGLPFDGIIYIDTQVVEELIGVTGPIQLYGREFSAKTDERCNCPNIIFELEHYAEIAAKGEADRKAILGDLMQQILARVIGAEVEKIPVFLDTVVRLANDKHIMFYMHDPDTQKAISALNWTGEIKNFDGDYLHINDSNFAGGKSNLYVEQTVTQNITVKGEEVKKKVTIEYKNPQKFDRWLNGINRDYVRLYVPKGSELVNSKGSEQKVTTIEDLDKTVFEAFIQVRPQNSVKLEFEYTLPYKPSGDYQLMVQKQPGAKDHRYIIKVNGSEKADFRLKTDREFKFGI
jgi:hypothetical protein